MIVTWQQQRNAQQATINWSSDLSRARTKWARLYHQLTFGV
jgi:hypothetical protein